MLLLIVSATVTNLQQKLEGLQTANTLMKEDITIAKSNIVQLQQENLNLRRDKETLLDEHHRQMQVRQSAIFHTTVHGKANYLCNFFHGQYVAVSGTIVIRNHKCSSFIIINPSTSSIMVKSVGLLLSMLFACLLTLC